MNRALASLVVALASLPAAAGEVRGTVRYRGPVPELPPLKVNKDQGTCGESIPDESLLAAGGRLVNAVVELRGLPGGPPVPKGSTLELVSADPILHNVHGWIGRSTTFNQAMASPGQRLERVLDRPGLVQVKCDVHDWMAAWVMVTEGPAAVSGSDGAFVLRGVPAGSYTAVTWHERLGERVQQLTVPGEGAVELIVTFERGRP
jgi:hypothetical protein